MINPLTFEKYCFVYARVFDVQLKRLIGDMRIADDFVRGVEWHLCRGAEKGEIVVVDPRIIRIAHCALHGYSDIGVYYSVVNERVHLLSVHNSELAGE